MRISSDSQPNLLKKGISSRKVINFSHIDYRLSKNLSTMATPACVYRLSADYSHRLSETLSTFRLLMGGPGREVTKKPGDFKNPSVFCFGRVTIILLCQLDTRSPPRGGGSTTTVAPPLERVPALGAANGRASCPAGRRHGWRCFLL